MSEANLEIVGEGLIKKALTGRTLTRFLYASQARLQNRPLHIRRGEYAEDFPLHVTTRK